MYTPLRASLTLLCVASVSAGPRDGHLTWQYLRIWTPTSPFSLRRFIATAKELVLQSTVAFFESHLSRSDAPGVPLTDEQRIAMLEAVVQRMPAPRRTAMTRRT